MGSARSAARRRCWPSRGSGGGRFSRPRRYSCGLVHPILDGLLEVALVLGIFVALELVAAPAPPEERREPAEHPPLDRVEQVAQAGVRGGLGQRGGGDRLEPQGGRACPTGGRACRDHVPNHIGPIQILVHVLVASAMRTSGITSSFGFGSVSPEPSPGCSHPVTCTAPVGGAGTSRTEGAHPRTTSIAGAFEHPAAAFPPRHTATGVTAQTPRRPFCSRFATYMVDCGSH